MKTDHLTPALGNPSPRPSPRGGARESEPCPIGWRRGSGRLRYMVWLLVLLLQVAVFMPRSFGVLAPIYFKYTPDICFIDQNSNCLPVDMTYVSAMQRAGVNVTVEYGDDLNGWTAVEYSSAPPEDQIIYFAWFTQVPYRAPLRFFRAVESAVPTDFFAPLPRLPGTIDYYHGVVKQH